MQHAPQPATAPSPARCSTTCARLNAGAEPLGVLRRRRRRHHRRAPSEDLDINGPLLAPGLRRPGRHRRPTSRRIFGAAARWVLPSSSREVLPAGPDADGAARRGPARQRRRVAASVTREAASPWSLAAGLPALATGCAQRPAGRLLRGGRGAPGRAQRRSPPRASAGALLEALPTPTDDLRRARRPRHRGRVAAWSSAALRGARGGARRRRRRPRVVRPGAATRRRSPDDAREAIEAAARELGAQADGRRRWPASSSRPSTCARRRCQPVSHAGRRLARLPHAVAF